MAFLTWNDKMSVGSESLDNDHRTLLGLINQLHNHLDATPLDHAALDAVFDELLAYTRYHFEVEERLMKLCRYPDYEVHRELHAALTDEVERLVAGFRADPARFKPRKAYDFLSDWLMKHILREDMKYRPFLQNKPASKA